MRTLTRFLFLIILSTLLIAQIDSTETNPATADTTDNTVEALVITDSTSAVIVEADSTETETVPSDSATTALVGLDSAAVDSSTLTEMDTLEIEPPEMVWVPKDPKPVSVSGLMNQGPLYYWSNDGLEGLGLDQLDYVTIEDPTMIAVKANDCLDIVCHLLATDSSGIGYVIVTPEDSSDLHIYDTFTKTVIIEAPVDSIVGAFDAYLRDLAGMEYIAVAPEIEPGPSTAAISDLAMEQPLFDSRARALKIKHRQFRSSTDIFGNPANLARDFDSFTSWLLPDFKLSIHNSLLTPGWYKTWWTGGEIWDADMKADYLSTLMDQDLALNIIPEFQSIFGFRIWRFGVNLAGISHLKLVLPGNILGLPMQDILLNEPIENGGLEIEMIPFVAKTTFSYAQPFSTPFGNIKIGVGMNVFEAAGYMNMVSNDFTVQLTQDSVYVNASGEGWATTAGIQGHADDLDLDNIDATTALSDPSFGIDLGLIMDLQPLIKQELEVQLSLNNIGAQYKWTDITHQSWTFEQVMPAPGDAELDSIEQYQRTTDSTLATGETLVIELPSVLNVGVIYQPLSWILIGAEIEQAFTDESRFGYTPDLAFNYQLNLFPFPWLDFSYYKQTQYGEPVHTFGSGFHFGFLDTGLTLSFFNDLNTDAKGIGFGLSSSLHF